MVERKGYLIKYGIFKPKITVPSNLTFNLTWLYLGYEIKVVCVFSVILLKLKFCQTHNLPRGELWLVDVWWWVM